MLDVALTAAHRRTVVIKQFSLFYLIYDWLTITVLDGRNIFPASFAPFYVLVELRPTFTFFA